MSKHNLTIEFNSKEELLAYLNGSAGTPKNVSVSAPVQAPTPERKVGMSPELAAPYGQAPVGAIIAPDMPAALTPIEKARETKARNAAAKKLAEQSALGADPVSNTQPAPTAYVPPIQQAAPLAQAPIAPMPSLQAAPVLRPAADPSSPRGQWDAACIAIVNDLKASGVDANTFGNVMGGSFTQIGLDPKSKITQIEDAQIQAFYPVLKANADAAKAQLQNATY